MSEIAEIFGRVFGPKPKVNVWQWAEKNLVLSERVSPNYPGPYRTEHCPYVREPQEAFTDPTISTIVLCWSSRSSKTETLLNPVRYTVAADPQATIVVMPSKDFAKDFAITRWRPVVDDCEALAREKPDNPNMYKLTEMHFKRCTVWMLGSNSPANLKSRGATVLYGDEIDAWPERSKKETGALEQALERTKDRWNKKHLLSSTPTIENGQIWREFQLGDCRYYEVPCPKCGKFQTLKLKNLEFDKARRKDGSWDMLKIREVTWYKCEVNGCRIQDADKGEMLLKGKWVATRESQEYGRRSYHLNSLYPVWIAFHQVAAMFLQSKTTKEQLQRFVNSWLAEPFYEYGDNKEEEDRLKKLQTEDLPEGVPDGHAAILTADVQMHGVYWSAFAWGPGRECIQLDHGYAPALEEVEQMGLKWGCKYAFIDSKYRQQLVVGWCSTHPGWIPAAGAAGLMTSLRWAMIPIDAGIMKGREIRAIRFRPDEFKEEIHKRMKGDGLPIQFLKKLSADYKKQLLGERRVERRGTRGRTMIEWVKVGANHYWDNLVLQFAAFEAVRPILFEIQAPRDEKPPPMAKPEDDRPPAAPERDDVWGGER